jgi:hypothetical protein
VHTDSSETDAFINHKAPVGKLEGVGKAVLPFGSPLVPKDAQFRGTDFLNQMTAHLALNSLDAPAQRLEALVLGAAELTLVGTVPYYKARPLNGIWATAPYLHNGSVPTLWDILLPKEDRAAKFCVGDGQYDVKKVGYQTYRPQESPCPDHTSLVDTSKLGSHNTGHEWGTKLSNEERRKLIEYLKTL